jgi:tetratricopeptide (TPR) repeat protein
MLFGNRFWGPLLAISSLLLAGCGSLNSHSQKASHNTSESEAVVETAPDRSADKTAQAHAHFAAGVIHDINEETEAALEEFYKAAQGDLANDGLILDVTRRLIQNKQPEKALELLTQATAQPNASGVLFARLGLVYAQLGKTDLAIAANRTAIKRAPESLSGYQNLFLSYLQNKQPQEALKVLDDASKQPHPDAEFLIDLSELYGSYMLQFPAQKDKISPKALTLLNRAAKLKPTNPLLRLRLADDYSALGDLDSASQLYLDLLKQLPDLPIVRQRVHAKLAAIYLRSSDHKRATEQLEAVIRDDPTNPQAYYYLGFLAYNDKKTPEAAEYYNKTILLNPDFEPAYYDLALAYISLNKADDALVVLEKARKKFPQNFAMELWSGLAYSRQKNYAEALRRFTAAEVIAKATDPSRLNEDFYFQLGAAYERTGDLAAAEQYFDKCLHLAPDSAEAQNYLGYMWAEHGINLEKARELIEKAVKKEPKNGAYLDSLGWVLFKLNQPQKALEYELKAVELTSEPDATVFDHLGDIYLALNQPDKAREAWNKSLALEPSDTVRKKLQDNASK